MWMGGTPPLGYRPDGRSLAIVKDHAGIIHSIFRAYLDLGNVRLLQDRLEIDGIVKPTRRTKAGRPYGGGPFSRGELYAILGNPIYIGRIRHGKTTYPGLHPAIIEQEMWDAVQKQLKENGRGTRSSPRVRHPSILTGKLFDDRDEPLIARSEEHTSELQSLMRISYAVFCLNTKKTTDTHTPCELTGKI